MKIRFPGIRDIFLLILFFALNTSSHASDDIVLGVATSLRTLEGGESFRAVELAVDEINALGGVKVGDKKMRFRIEKIDLLEIYPGIPVEESLKRIENIIIKQKVNAVVVGPYKSEVMLPAMDMFSSHKVPLLAALGVLPAAEVKIMKDTKYKYIFRICINSKYLVSCLINMMKFLNERFGFNKVFVINQDRAWERTTTSLMFKLFFDKAGWEVLGMEFYPTGATDFRAALTKARKKGAQIILPIFDMPTSSNLVRQWKDLKVPALLCGFISPMIGPSAWKKSEGKVAGVMNLIFELGNVPSDKYKPADAFYRAYMEKFGRGIEAGHGPSPSYESVYIFADAIEKAGSLDPDRIVTCLEETDRVGAMGRIKFHKGHQTLFGEDPEAEALACVIQWTKEGKRKIIYPLSIAEGDIELPSF
ncbi:MAG TPA: ABC transporter substrate-binding protein [Desulfobacteraceae bacterium]|nr:ABC transporter substrate-binding protein [Desulfobacteraceae bacterium]HPJ68054.1 ABC transporter substrate-binding protein [Desulfobacteraceae bacterium]HPQ28395.1 ABC transporter substrate-binding protein [Desulfobacteraceae bacterium]